MWLGGIVCALEQVGREVGTWLGEGFACVDIICTHASCEPSCCVSHRLLGVCVNCVVRRRGDNNPYKETRIGIGCRCMGLFGVGSEACHSSSLSFCSRDEDDTRTEISVEVMELEGKDEREGSAPTISAWP